MSRRGIANQPKEKVLSPTKQKVTPEPVSPEVPPAESELVDIREQIGKNALQAVLGYSKAVANAGAELAKGNVVVPLVLNQICQLRQSFVDMAMIIPAEKKEEPKTEQKEEQETKAAE